MNKAILVGRLGQDPQMNDKGNMVNFSIATNDGYGESKKTNWHNCRAFGKVAEIIQKFAKKGDNISICGSVDYYTNAEGKNFTSIIVNDVTLLGSKQEQATDLPY